MKRREFFKMLAGLPFLAFLKENKKSEEILTKERAPKLSDSPSVTFHGTENWGKDYWVHWPDGRITRF